MAMTRMAVGGVLLLTMGAGVSAVRAQDEEQDEEKAYRIAGDGTVSWSVFNGFRRYHGICHTCHGPDGLGSSFAPNLLESLKAMDRDQFYDVVVNGRSNVNTASNKQMPSFGTDFNVMCFIDDIHAYLKARSDGALGRGRPASREPKSEQAREAEQACLGG